jgi:hypothetical protein
MAILIISGILLYNYTIVQYIVLIMIIIYNPIIIYTHYYINQFHVKYTMEWLNVH